MMNIFIVYVCYIYKYILGKERCLLFHNNLLSYVNYIKYVTLTLHGNELLRKIDNSSNIQTLKSLPV